ncbi:MAG TPA: methyltransferase domain-containing protein [Gemmatimonadales bacterium]|nr:methyltransferase domain-containing protein [Gemmatimonadales bacterium]
MPELVISPIGSELLDDPGADPAIVAESLRNIARANRWFGGAAAVRYGLSRALGDVSPGQRVALLDVGTGLGDLPRTAVQWGAKRRIEIVPVGLELNRAAAALAVRNGVPTIVACAGTPPIRDKSVDVVLVSQVAHHLSPDSIVHLFRTCDRMARRAVIIADLRRHSLAAPSFRFGARLLGFDAVTRTDGVTSIRRGFSRRELLDLLELAGVRGRVDQKRGFRLVATWRAGT